jgi:hypothetical protein
LLKAQARGGWGATFSLSYNSQMWRKDAGGTWLLGRDVGYGIGWQLQAGALAPYYTDFWTLHHYNFTDSTGAVYRLMPQADGSWRSSEDTLVEYDPATGKL